MPDVGLDVGLDGVLMWVQWYSNPARKPGSITMVHPKFIYK